MGIRKLKAFTAAAFVVLCVLWGPLNAYATVTNADAFNDIAWTEVFSDPLQSTKGVVQSMCSTENYIITIENASGSSTEPDTVSAYYKNTTDANGNPVTQYSLAKRVTDTDWEHGNGMAYDPRTKLIYVAPYSNLTASNRGVLFVMDPNTLEKVNTIHISDSWNVLGIAYIEKTDQFVILTNVDGGYDLRLYDSSFSQYTDFGTMQTDGAVNFQDICVTGDFVLLQPLGLKDGNYLRVFSMSERKIVANVKLSYTVSNVKTAEPEDIAEISPGVFLMSVTENHTDGSTVNHFYETVLKTGCSVTASATGGSVSLAGTTPEGTQITDFTDVEEGSTITVTFQPDAGNVISSLIINGQGEEVTEDESSYTISNITGNIVLSAGFDLPDAETDAGSAVTEGSLSMPDSETTAGADTLSIPDSDAAAQTADSSTVSTPDSDVSSVSAAAAGNEGSGSTSDPDVVVERLQLGARGGRILAVVAAAAACFAGVLIRLHVVRARKQREYVRRRHEHDAQSEES